MHASCSKTVWYLCCMFAIYCTQYWYFACVTPGLISSTSTTVWIIIVVVFLAFIVIDASHRKSAPPEFDRAYCAVQLLNKIFFKWNKFHRVLVTDEHSKAMPNLTFHGIPCTRPRHPFHGASKTQRHGVLSATFHGLYGHVPWTNFVYFSKVERAK